MIKAALVVALIAAQDTTLTLRAGDHIDINRFSGDLVVTGVSGDRLELRSDDDDQLEVRREGSTVMIRPSRGRRGPRSVDAALRVPSWVSVSVTGASFDVEISGIEGSVEVGNLEGDVVLQDLGGGVRVVSVEGEVMAERVSGGVSVSLQSEDVILRDVSGPIEVSSGDGDLTLINVESRSVRAETQDGDVAYSGSIVDGGDYRFFLHSGDATLAVSPDINARFAVSTFDGDFESSFPVRVQSFTTGREFEFVLGDGSARVEIEVFDGEIRLLQR